ncbi:biotin--[acetyl-CoA-carboxylase] ligase [Parasediminibacterium sp. JCM 36343]|uniref:biotin--[acetyl-CoA-carboxylase] ligase n=1 Tax=Parasediminibacterium sp. JCM 36343 TaxID=3374279 RepID=UPI00397DB3CE
MPLTTANKDSNFVFPEIGSFFIELDEVASTNSYAIDKIQANLAAHGTAFFAHAQTAGRGQRGRQWVAEAGSNIIISCVVDTRLLSMQQQFSFSVCIALACRNFFASNTGGDAAIKWPNDIYWRDRKAGGILIENIIRGQEWHWAVVGIGININQTVFPDGLKNPVSLRQITGKLLDAVALAKQLCTFLEASFQELLSWGAPKQLAAYNQYLYKANEQILLKKDSAVFSCTIKGVNEYGQLLVSGCSYDFFEFGEVEWVV